MPNNIRFQVGFDVDRKGLDSIKKELESIRTLTRSDYLKINVDTTDMNQVNQDLASINYAASTVENALEKAFNPKLNSINIQRFNQILDESNLTLDEIYTAFNKAGVQGQSAFRNISNAVLGSNTQLEHTQTVLDRMAQTLGNTLKWNIASSAINTLTGNVEQAYGYVKSLDSSLNDIRIVTGQSAAAMEEFAAQANDAASGLGAATTEYTNAALIYYQQGLDPEEVAERSRVTLMTANVTGQDAADVSEQLTAVWNGYQVSAEEAELYVDRLAVAAAITAADLEELSDGMSRVASTAAVLGVSEEQLASQLATIISITRQAPESIGTALRSIYSRMSDIQAGISDDGATLDYYTKQMAELGINVLTAQGQLRDMGEVIEEVGGNWADFTREQQISIAQTMAGTRQFNNLIALFDNWDMYTSTLDAVNDAQGALQEQQDIYMESTRAHLQQLGTQWEDLFDSILDPDTINTGADALAAVVNLVTQLVDGLGGGQEALLAFGAIATKVFSTQMASGLNTQLVNIRNFFQEIRNSQQQLDMANELSAGHYDEITNAILRMQAQAQQYDSIWTESQAKRAQELIKEIEQIKTTSAAWEEAREKALSYLNQGVITQVDSDNGVVPGSNYYNADWLNNLSESSNLSLQDAAQNAAERFRDLNTTAKAVSSIIKETRDGILTASLSTEDLNNNYEQVYQTAQNVLRILQEQERNLDGQGEQYEEIRSQIASLESILNAADSAGQGGENLVKDDNLRRRFLNLTNSLVKSSSTGIEQAELIYQVLEDAAYRASNTIEDGAQKAGAAYEEFSALIKDSSTINALVDTAGAAMSVFSAIQSIQGLGRIWTDENISGTEAMTQTMFALANATMQGVSAFGILASNADTLRTLGSSIVGLVGGASQLGIILGSIAAIAAAIGLVVKLVDEATTTTAEYREQLEQSKKNIEENKVELESLQSQLEANNQQIDEINSKELKSIVDEQDITNLRIQNSLLESQIELLERKQQTEVENSQRNYEGQLDATLEEVNDPDTMQLNDTSGQMISIGANDVEGFQNWAQAQAKRIVELRRLGLDKWAETLEQGLEEAQARFEEMNNEYVQEVGLRAQEALEYLVTNPGDAESIQKAQEIVKSYYEAAGTYKQVVADGLKEVIQANNEDWQELLEVNPQLDIDNFDTSAWQKLFGEDIWSDINNEAAAAGLSVEDFMAALADDSGIINLQNITAWLEDNVTASENAASSMAQYQSAILELQDALAAGSYTDLNEDQLAALQELESEFQVLAQIQDKSSHEYLETLRQINEMIEDNQRDEREAALESEKLRARALKAQQARYERGQETVHDFDVEINADRLEDSINNILQQKHELNVEVNMDDISTDVTQALDFVGEYQRILETIPESLEITVAQGEAIINAGYGAMLIDAEATAEGMIRLNQQQRDFFIQAKQQELEASRQSYITQLEQERDLVGYQIDAISARLEALLAAQNTDDSAKKQSALEEAERQTQLYNTYAEKLTQQLQADEDYSHQAGVIADSLEEYRTAATETALHNQQLDESDATTQQAREINKRIQNLEKYYNRLVEIGLATKQAMQGEVTVGFGGERATGGGGIVSSNEIEGRGRTLPELGDELKIEPIDPDEFMDLFNSDETAANKQLQEQIDVTREVLATLNETYGKLDFAIASFDTVPNLFDQIGIKDSGSKKGGSEPNHKEIDLYSDRDDPFAEINEEISQYEANLEALQEMEDQVYGKSYVKNLNDQLKVIEDLKAAEQERLDIASQQREKLSQELTGLGFTFTDAGVLDRSRLNEAKDYYDELATRYNAMSGAEQESQAGQDLTKQIEDQKLLIELMEAVIADWDTMNSESQDASTSLASLDSQILEIKENLLPGEELSMVSELLDLLDEFVDITDLIDDRLSALSDEQEHLVGDSLIANLSSQIETLDLKKLTLLVDGIKDLGAAALDLRDVKKNYDGIVSGLKELSNYNDILETDYGIEGIDVSKLEEAGTNIGYIASKVGELMAAYNSTTQGDQAGTIGNLISGVLGLASGNPLGVIQLIMSALSLITNVIGTIRNLFNKWREIQEEQIQLQIERFNVPVEVTLDLYDLQKQWNEFRRNVIDDIADNDFIGQIEASLREIQQYYNGLDFSTSSSFDSSSISSANSLVGVLSGHLATVMDEVNKMNAGEKSEIYGDHLADALEDMENYTTQLMDALTDVAELEDEINEAYLSGWDEIKDGLQEQVDEYERITNEIEHNRNIISMLYGDDAYEELDAFYDLEEKANSGRLQYLTAAVAEWDAIKQKMIESGETSGEAWDKVVEAQRDAQEQLNQALEDAIQNIIDKYQNTVESIFAEMTDKLTGGMGLDYMEDQWDLINERADRYLDDINRAYEITQLQSKVQDAINDNDGNLEAQEQIRDVMDEQLAYLENKENLTEYDVERAEKLLDIELKRLALQNAQQNQTTMRLRRDANGNYSYEYVADEDAVSSAEDELAAAENELYNFDKDNYNQNLQDIFNMYQNYNEQMKQIAMDNTLTEEQRLQYMAMLNEEYQNQLNMLVGDNETIRNNLTSSAFAAYSELYNMNKEQFIQMTEDEKNAFMSNLVETWDSGLQQMADAIAGEGGFQVIANEALEQIKEAQDAYNESLEQTKADIDGLDFTDFQESIDNILTTINDTIGANEEVIDTYDEMADQLISVNQQAQAYLATLEAQNQAIYEQIQLSLELQAASKTPGLGQDKDEDAPWWYDALVNIALPGGLVGNIVTGGGVTDATWNGLKDFFGFDTGGYTGDWNNNNGRLAVLHEKELVLNQDDTSNILQAVDYVRQMTDMSSDLPRQIADAIQNNLNNRLEDMIAASRPADTELNPIAQEIEQTVHIEANFPNVTDRNEIQQAFSNLVNIAAQRAMDTRI